MKRKVVIVSSSVEIAGALFQFFKLFDFEDVIPAEEASLVDIIRDRRKEDCLVAVASNQPSEWLRWFYQIRCVAKFRGPCALITAKTKEELEPAKYHQLLFKHLMVPHQDCFQYLRLFDLLKWMLIKAEKRDLKYRISYTRLRRMQKKIKGLYLPSKHGWGTHK